jgi:DNA-binding transcriptional regulator PaaX
MPENTKTIKQIIENFLCSDSKSATATKFLLMTLAVGGVVFTGALFPALVSIMNESKQSKRFSKKQIRGTFDLLKQRRLIEIVREKDGKTRVNLTNKGQTRIKEFCFEELQISKTKQWDKKWRILIYDIPTKPKIYNKAREALRVKIKEIGFIQLQKSVWVCPYECEDEILFLAECYSVTKFIEILTVEKLLHSDQLKRKFEL